MGLCAELSGVIQCACCVYQGVKRTACRDVHSGPQDKFPVDVFCVTFTFSRQVEIDDGVSLHTGANG